MSAPVEQFSSLSLQNPMAFNVEDIALRKIEIRDIISSFDRLVLPSEYKGDIFNRIDAAQSERPSEEWTIPEDLPGTLMQWGVHDLNCWQFLNQCQSPSNRARLLHEKLGRRFDNAFAIYNHLPNSERDGHTVELTPPEIRDAVHKTSEQLQKIVAAAQSDRQTRRLGEDGTARQLLRALNTVCNCYEDVSHVRRSGRRSTSGSEPETSLFLVLISDQVSNGNAFMIDALEGISAPVLADLKTEMQTVYTLLTIHKAPDDYRSKFESLLKKADIEVPSLQSPAEPSTGSKRAAAESSGRRGKRKTTK